MQGGGWGEGITEKGEGHTKLPVDQRISHPYQKRSRWSLCTTEQRQLMHAHLAHRPSLWALELQKTDTHNVDCFNYNCHNGVSCEQHGESPQSWTNMNCSVRCEYYSGYYSYCLGALIWSHFHKLKMTTQLGSTNSTQWKITVYVASSFLSVSKHWNLDSHRWHHFWPLAHVFVCTYVLTLQVGVLRKAPCSNVHPQCLSTQGCDLIERALLTKQNLFTWYTPHLLQAEFILILC